MRQTKNEDRLPWRQLMEIAFGVLGLAPDIFWGMTPPEWIIAFQGWKKSHGIVEKPGYPAMNHAELAAMKKQFPDRVIAPENAQKAF